MKYSAKYFSDSLPDWKKKKDPVLSRIFYRPVSFYLASLATKMKLTANTVSYYSAVIGIIACLLFLIDHIAFKITGALLINLWLILDCTDGNIARSVKRQPYGEFADGISSYILVGLMCTTIGFSVYQTGGVIVAASSPWIILLGALASSADTMMRLIYQKYKNTSRDMMDKGIIPYEKDERTDTSNVTSLRVRFEAELGIGGILPVACLLTAIFQALDLFVLYCFAYYGLSCIASTLLLIRRARKAENI